MKKKQLKKAFTIIEILIVVGIIGILAVALLVLVNPAEAQRRTRDTKRLKDAQFIDSVIKQYLDDGNNFGANCSTTDMCYTAAAGNTDTTTCDNVSSNWLGEGAADLCNYAKAIPVDPLNTSGSTCVDDSQTGDVDNTCNVYYTVAVSGTNYEVNVRQESTTNIGNITGDNGNSVQWYEVFSGPNDLIDDDIYNGGAALP